MNFVQMFYFFSLSLSLLVTKGIATRSKKLLVAPGHTTSNKKLLVKFMLSSSLPLYVYIMLYIYMCDYMCVYVYQKLMMCAG